MKHTPLALLPSLCSALFVLIYLCCCTPSFAWSIPTRFTRAFYVPGNRVIEYPSLLSKPAPYAALGWSSVDQGIKYESLNTLSILGDLRMVDPRPKLAASAPYPTVIFVTGLSEFGSGVNMATFFRGVNVPRIHAPFLLYLSSSESEVTGSFLFTTPTWAVLFLPDLSLYERVCTTAFEPINTVPNIARACTAFPPWSATAQELREKAQRSYDDGDFADTENISEGLVTVDYQRDDVPKFIKLIDLCMEASASLKVRKRAIAEKAYMTLIAIELDQKQLRAANDSLWQIAYNLHTKEPRFYLLGAQLQKLANQFFDDGELDKAEKIFRKAYDVELSRHGVPEFQYKDLLVQDLMGLALDTAAKHRYSESTEFFNRASDRAKGILILTKSCIDSVTKYSNLMHSVGLEAEAAQADSLADHLKKRLELQKELGDL